VWFDLTHMSTGLVALVVSTVAMFVIAVAFLIAASVLRRANNRKAAHWARLETSWGTTIECIFHGVANADSLRPSGADRLVFVDYLYKSISSETRPGRRSLLRQLAVPHIPVVTARIRTGDIWQRARAIRTVAELAGADADGMITGALQDPAPHVALTAARTYARLRLGPIDPVLDRIERYQDWDRRLLRLTLSSFGPAAAPALHQRFADPDVPARIRAVCADALAEMDYEPVNDTALAVLREEADIDLRASALRGIRGPVADRHRYLVRSLCGAEDQVIRAQAVACLARIGDEADMTELERALADLSPWVVLNATRGLSTRRGAAAPLPAVATPAGPVAADEDSAIASFTGERS
jgi:HEAT repeat protein